MPGFWDDPDLKKAAENGDFMRFNDVGDTVSGTVQALKKVNFDGRVAIEVQFDDERKCTFGQVLMLRELYALQPVKGDQLTVTLAAIEKKAGAKTLKLFRGDVTHANGEVENFDQTAS